jgi:diguanylate cyclase (GGDEF)-like protein
VFGVNVPWMEEEGAYARLDAGERILALESDLQRSRSYLQAVLNNIDSGVMLVDQRGRVVFANAALENFMDRPASEAIGLERAQVIAAMAGHFDDYPAFVDAVAPPEGLPGAAATADWEMKWPQRRVIRWSARRVALAEGAGTLEIWRDVTAEADLTRRLREQAVRDPLTGLLNRRGGEDQLGREVARAHRENRPLSVAMLDVDHFKQVNDQFGHEIGDRVLRGLARTMADCVRAYDFVARWGGEEWLAVMPGAARNDAHGIVERIRSAVEAFRSEGLPAVTISAGVDELAPGETTGAGVIARADARLYQAKSAGRNRVV